MALTKIAPTNWWSRDVWCWLNEYFKSAVPVRGGVSLSDWAAQGTNRSATANQVRYATHANHA